MKMCLSNGSDALRMSDGGGAVGGAFVPLWLFLLTVPATMRVVSRFRTSLRIKRFDCSLAIK
jgi:hypothetical protein